MIKTYQYLLAPTKKQKQDMRNILYLCQQLYNAGLQERIDCYKKTGKTVSCYEQLKSLTEIRANDIRYKSFSAQVARSPLKRLDKAYKSFFLRVKKGEKAGFPRFQSLRNYKSFDLGENYKLDLDDCLLSFKGAKGKLLVRKHREIIGKVKTCSVAIKNKKWYVNVMVEFEPEVSLDTGAIGLDMGITHSVIDSNGVFYDNQRFLKAKERALRISQRTMARRFKRGNVQSKNYYRAKNKTAKLYESVANARKNWQWHTIKEILIDNKTVVVEDLKIKNMVKNKNLSKHIHDASWGNLVEKLIFKAESAGKSVIKVSPHNTSQICSSCGEIVKKELSQRTHKCNCGTVLHRDVNAAINILKRGGISPLEHKVGVSHACSAQLTFDYAV